MATAREAKHINCRLTPQKQHDLIPAHMQEAIIYLKISFKSNFNGMKGKR